MRAPVSSIAGGCRASPRPAGERWWRSPWSPPPLVAVVLAVGRKSDVERQSAEPRPSPTRGKEGAPSDFWEAPIVDEPIPRGIASRFAIFRDPRPGGELPRDPHDPQARNSAGRPGAVYTGALSFGAVDDGRADLSS